MSHKAQMAAVVSAVFFCIDEFADIRLVNGQPMHVVDDTDSLVDWKDGQHTDGLYASDKLLRVSANEYGPRPKAGAAVKIDGLTYIVVEATDDAGVYALRLRRAKA